MTSKRSSSSVLYTGPSMNPVFYLGDELFYDEPPLPLTRGDIIIYPEPQKEGQVVIHRIIGISKGTIRTAGDNNPVPDPYRLRADQVIGRVSWFRRGDFYHPVRGGYAGLATYYLNQVRRIFLACPVGIITQVYHRVAGWYLICRFTEPLFSPRLVVVKNREMILLQLYIHTRLIGMKRQDQDAWSVFPPWRLFIDSRDLPVDHEETLRQAERRG